MKYGVEDVFYAKSLQKILVLILCEALAKPFPLWCENPLCFDIDYL